MRSLMKVLPALLLTGSAAPASWAASTQITGGFNAHDRALTWQITNTGSSDIVRIEIPHYHADSVELPDGWDSKTTNLVVKVPPSAGGLTTFTSVAPGSAIQPGSTKTFGQHLSLAPFVIGKGSVTVHYADGSSEIVPNVEISLDSTQLGLGVLAAIGAVVLLVVYAIFRSRRPGNTSSPAVRDEVV
jgi:hypothetical protein